MHGPLQCYVYIRDRDTFLLLVHYRPFLLSVMFLEWDNGVWPNRTILWEIKVVIVKIIYQCQQRNHRCFHGPCRKGKFTIIRCIEKDLWSLQSWTYRIYNGTYFKVTWKICSQQCLPCIFSSWCWDVNISRCNVYHPQWNMVYNFQMVC